ncbi:hypothetical protein [Amycolatopsis magusensis]|uniref:hypothetical protein n=1 Tax=Amycolatopsis magusensis TaxID=882444 RepID=UPI003C2BA46B
MWTELVAAIPWLRQLDPRGLDLDELVVPAGEVAGIRERLERELGAHVMTYRVSVPRPGAKQLCRMLVTADLSAAAVGELREAEERTGVVFCAYARPLQLRVIPGHRRRRA